MGPLQIFECLIRKINLEETFKCECPEAINTKIDITSSAVVEAAEQSTMYLLNGGKIGFGSVICGYRCLHYGHIYTAYAEDLTGSHHLQQTGKNIAGSDRFQSSVRSRVARQFFREVKANLMLISDQYQSKDPLS